MNKEEINGYYEPSIKTARNEDTKIKEAPIILTRWIDLTIDESKKENQALRERVAYLERSNNRREDTIIEQYHEIVELEGKYKELDKMCELYSKSLYNAELNQYKCNWNKLKDELRQIRQSTFTKYGKNEWENCLSFNDDILPLIKKMQELEQGSDNND